MVGMAVEVVSLCSNRRRKVLLETTNEDLKVEIKLVSLKKNLEGMGWVLGRMLRKRR